VAEPCARATCRSGCCSPSTTSPASSTGWRPTHSSPASAAPVGAGHPRRHRAAPTHVARLRRRHPAGARGAADQGAGSAIGRLVGQAEHERPSIKERLRQQTGVYVEEIANAGRPAAEGRQDRRRELTSRRPLPSPTSSALPFFPPSRQGTPARVPRPSAAPLRHGQRRTQAPTGGSWGS
jgi:hypothetical protein